MSFYPYTKCTIKLVFLFTFQLVSRCMYQTGVILQGLDPHSLLCYWIQLFRVSLYALLFVTRKMTKLKVITKIPLPLMFYFISADTLVVVTKNTCMFFQSLRGGVLFRLELQKGLDSFSLNYLVQKVFSSFNLILPYKKELI